MVKVKILKDVDCTDVTGEYVFDDNVLNSDTATQLIAYGLKNHEDNVLEFLETACIYKYNDEKVNRTLTVVV